VLGIGVVSANAVAPPGGGIGMEMLQNGNLLSNVGWNVGANWAIAGGTATKSAGAANNIDQGVLIVGQTYTVSFTVVTQTAGNVNASIGSGTVGPNITGPGSYTFTGVCAGSVAAAIKADLACDAVISKISCRTTGL
jgi:hypothetical protein